MTICKKPGLELFRGTILCGFRSVTGTDTLSSSADDQPASDPSFPLCPIISLTLHPGNQCFFGRNLPLFIWSINQSINEPTNQSINQCGTPPQLIKLTGQGTTWFHKKQIIRFHFCASFVLHLHFCISNCTSLHLVGIWSHLSASYINCSNTHR